MVCEPLLDYDVTFVTSIPVTGAAPTGTMSLVSDGWCVTSDTRLPPPLERRASASSQLADGTLYPSMTYENRILELRLTLEADNADALALQMQRLHRELDKPRNVLMFKPKTSEAVYFKTWRADADAIRVVRRAQNLAQIDVDVPADPFGYGSKQIVGTFTVLNDPDNVVTGVAEDFEDATLDIVVTDGGDLPWERTTAEANTGTWSFRSGAITHSQTSDAIVTVPAGATRLRFSWKVSSEDGFDFFEFFVDNSLKFSASGEEGWVESRGFDVSNASTVTFHYEKDGSVSSGSDAAFVDDVIFYEFNGENAMFFDVTGVAGDVDTFAFLSHESILGTRDTSRVVATRRRGDPSRIPLLLQAEDMRTDIEEFGTGDTTRQPHDATASGDGNNFARTDFSVDAEMSTKLRAQDWPQKAGIDLRGTYRAFTRVRRDSGSNTVVAVRVRWGSIFASEFFTGETVTSWSAAADQWSIIDLGLVSMPTTADPVFEGPSNVEIPVRGLSMIELQAEHAITGTPVQFDFDYLLLVPADESMLMYDSPVGSNTDNDTIIDGDNKVVYPARRTSGALDNVISLTALGGFPQLSPEEINRVIFMRMVGGAGFGENITDTTDITVAYWPRYIHTRPELT